MARNPYLAERTARVARLSTLIGLLLCGITVAILLHGGTARWSWAFVPMMVGIAMFISGIVAASNRRRRRAIIVASCAAAIGAVSCGTASLEFDAEAIRHGGRILMLGIGATALCVGFVVLAVIYFIKGRRLPSGVQRR